NALCTGIFNGDAHISFMVIRHHTPRKITSFVCPLQISLIDQMPQWDHDLKRYVNNDKSEDPRRSFYGRSLITNLPFRHVLSNIGTYFSNLPFVTRAMNSLRVGPGRNKI